MVGSHRALFIVLGLCWALATAAPALSAGDDAHQTWLEKFGAIVSLDVSCGYSDNAYLTPGSKQGDLLIDLATDIELTRTLRSSATVYMYGSVARRQYLKETDASETFVNILAEYERTYDPWALGLSGSTAYEDYHSFDEEGAGLPSDRYESLANRTRAFAALEPAEGHVFSTGVFGREKRYTSANLDFREIGSDISYNLRITPSVYARATFVVRQQMYIDYQARHADGTVSEGNPSLKQNVQTIRVRLIKKLPRSGRARLSVHQTTADEHFENEGAYSEAGISASGVIPLGRRHAIEGKSSVYFRNYENRLVSDDNKIQKDQFLTLSVTGERQIRGAFSAFLKVEINWRDSNDPADTYNENLMAVGCKALL